MSEKENIQLSKVVKSADNIQVEAMWDQKRKAAIEKNKRVLRSLYCVILISAFFIVAEVLGGLYANSIAIMSDAAHLASDALGIAFSVVALKIGERSADHRYSYGYHRAEIIGAICSILFIWIVTVWLLIEATKRLVDKAQPEGITMLWMSFVALAFNLVQMKILHGNSDLHDHAHGPGGGCNHDHGEEGHHHGHDHSHGHDHAHGHGGGCNHDHGEEGHHHGQDHSHKHANDDDYASVDNIKTHDQEAGYDQAFLSAKKNSAEKAEKKISQDSPQKTPLLQSFSKQEVANIENFKEHDHEHSHSHSHVKLTAAEQKAMDEANKRKRSLNVEAAYLHILGDVLNSVGVIIASFIIWISGNKLWYFDPICTYFFSCIVLYTTRKTFSHCITMLMEATPLEIANESVTKALMRVEGVISVHCLHIWAISEGKNAISVHLVCDDNAEPLRAVDKMLRDNFGIHHIACQIERERDFQCGGNDLHQC